MIRLTPKNGLFKLLKTPYQADYLFYSPTSHTLFNSMPFSLDNEKLDLIRPILEKTAFQLIKQNGFSSLHWEKNAEINTYQPVISYRKVEQNKKIATQPTEQLFNQAINYQQTGQLAEAILLYQQLLALNPQHSDALHYYGLAVADYGNRQQGIGLIKQALLISPNYPEAYNNLGFIYEDEGQLQQAKACYEKALQLKPDYSDAYCNLGGIYQHENNLSQAIDCYHHALLLEPQHSYSHYNLATIYQLQSNYSAAIGHYQQILKINPHHQNALFNLALVYAQQNNLSDAITSYQQVLKLDPHHAMAHFNLAIVYLTAGDYLKGFAEFEWRWQVRAAIEPKKIFPHTQEWEGQFFGNKTLFLYFEQGVGDAIQFIRYVRDISEHYGKSIIVQCPRVLISLFATIPEITQLIANEDPDLPPFDYYLSLLSLPRVLKTRLETIPLQIPYLKATKKIIIPSISKNKFNIGFVWAGNPAHENDKNRSLIVNYFSSLVLIKQTQFYSLQLGEQAQPLSELKAANPVLNLAQSITEFADTAAIIAQMDLIICVDTAIAHLAGALGKPTWILLPFAPDWRWLLHRDDSPWYPSVQLFRQTEAGNWQTVFAQLQTALVNHIATCNKTFINEKQLSYNINTALHYHQTGQLEQAKIAYQSLLHLNPNDAQALHYLGLIYHQQGDNKQAIVLLQQALAIDSTHAIYHNNLGISYLANKQFNHAIACYDNALKLEPNYAAAYYNKGYAYQENAQLEQAIACYQQALTINPDYTDCYYTLGQIYQIKNEFEQAISYYKKTLELNPNAIEAILQLAIISDKQQQDNQAVAYYEQALKINSDSAEIYCNLGNFYVKKQDYAQAQIHYEKALEINPNYIDAHCNLGVLYTQQQQFEQAIICFKKALEIDNTHLDTLCHLGNAYNCLNDSALALIYLEKAYTLNKQHPYTLSSLGLFYKTKNNLSTAISYYQKAIATDPLYANAHYNLSLSALLNGDYELGWQEYEWRYVANQRLTPAQQFPNQPYWQGELASDKTLLLYMEQGFGDAIQFIRYLELVANYVAKIIVQCHPALHRLFSTLPEIDQLINFTQPLPAFDLVCPLMSLPYLFKTDLNTIPSKFPYLQPDKKNSFPLPINKNKMAIGFVWAGNSSHKNDKQRSVEIRYFQTFADLTNVQFYSLYIGEKQHELTQLNFVHPIIEIAENPIDFAETAVAILQLDLIITVDTSVAHLAGALNKKTWVLLPFSPDWRWLLERNDSPWYVSMRLFRQPFAGDWNSVFIQLKQALLQEFPTITATHQNAVINESVSFQTALKFHQTGHLKQAQIAYQQLLNQQPNNSEILHYFGLLLHEQGNIKDGILKIEQAILINQHYKEAYNNLGLLYHASADIEKAITCYKKAIALDNHYADAHYNLALSLLLNGNYKQGWQEYEWRWQLSNAQEVKKEFSFAKAWQGESLIGKKILIYAEQGMGDAIQFIRYIDLIAKQAEKIIVQCPRALKQLFSSIPQISEIVMPEELLPVFDFYSPLMSLPYLLNTDFNSIPANTHYLIAPASASFAFLVDKTKFNIGLVWAGNPTHKNDKNRSIDISQFQSILQLESVQFYSLQTGKQRADLQKINTHHAIIDFGEKFANFADTAAVIQELDLIICVDTSIAHLAGALNKPVWVLLPFVPDWRWLLTTEKSPWYPSMRLFRQPAIADWKSVFVMLKKELESESVTFNKRKPQIIVQTKPLPDFDISIATDSALKYHQEGQFEQAKQLYEKILAIDENNISVLHYLGLIFHQLGDSKKAISLLKKSVSLNPDYMLAYNNLGIAYMENNQLDEAIDCYEKALQLNPHYAACYYNMGSCYHRKQQLTQAISCYEKALFLNPNYPEAQYNLGMIYQEHQPELAISCYEKVLAIQPHYAEAYLNLAVIYLKQENYVSAILYYEKVLAIFPDYPEAQCGLGNVYLKQKDFLKATVCYEKCLQLQPNNPDALCGLGTVYLEQNQFDLAIGYYKKTLLLNPNYAEAQCNLGIVYDKQDKLEKALFCYEKTLHLDENHEIACCEIANIYLKQHKVEAALSHYEKALRINSNYAIAHYNFAFALLLTGDYQRGWQEYEWRWLANQKMPPATKFPTAQQWQGESLNNKTIFLYTEQGLGDAIQFIRYAELVSKLGAKVIVQCQPALKNLFLPLKSIHKIITTNETLPAFDVFSPLMSLPHIFNTTVQTIPTYFPYLDGNKKLSFPVFLDKEKLNIGFVWAGNPLHGNDKQRSIEITHFQRLTQLTDVQFYSLLVGDKANDLKNITFANPVIDIGKKVTDFSDTATVITQLDLIICVDTSVAHLAGALNKPTWLLLPFAPDWRWLLERDDSPWYPSLKLFRQTQRGDWTGVFQAVAKELERLLQQKSQ